MEEASNGNPCQANLFMESSTGFQSISDADGWTRTAQFSENVRENIVGEAMESVNVLHGASQLASSQGGSQMAIDWDAPNFADSYAPDTNDSAEPLSLDQSGELAEEPFLSAEVDVQATHFDGSSTNLLLHNIPAENSGIEYRQMASVVVGTMNLSELSIAELNGLLAFNEAYRETLKNLISRVGVAIHKNREQQKILRITSEKGALETEVMKRVPVSRFLYPYFRDSHDMEPPKNVEWKEKMRNEQYDPIVRPDKKWRPNDLKTLWTSVYNSLLEQRTEPIIQKRDIIRKKISASIQEISSEQREQWEEEVDGLNRQIAYIKSLPEAEILSSDISTVDWVKISVTDFNNTHTPKQIRLKWINELCPRWSQEAWSAEEMKELRHLAARFSDWSVIAQELGTKRTAFQCLVKFKRDLDADGVRNLWTKEEDARLSVLAVCMQVAGRPQWTHVSHYMVDRSRQQCAMRYVRVLDPDLKSGRWSTQEDLLLTCGVGRFGLRDWKNIAANVPGRSDAQCRDRWVNVLSTKILGSPWSSAEDEILLRGIKEFGKGEWSQISLLLPGRTPAHCKSRFRTLLSAKIRLSTDCSNRPLKPYSDKSRQHREKVQKLFKQLLAFDGNDKAAEVLSRAFNAELKSDETVFDFTRLKPECKKTMLKIMDEVEQSRSSNTDDAMYDLLTKVLPINKSILVPSTRNAVMRYYKKYLNVRAGTNISDLKKELDEELSSIKDDEEKENFLLNLLCDAVEKNDLMTGSRSFNQFSKDDIVKKCVDFLSKVLIDPCNSASAMRKRMMVLPPFNGSIQLLHQLREHIPTMCRSVLEVFDRIVANSEEPFIELSRQVLLEPQYIMLQKKMKSLLYWPVMLDMAIESEESTLYRRCLNEFIRLKREKLKIERTESDEETSKVVASLLKDCEKDGEEPTVGEVLMTKFNHLKKVFKKKDCVDIEENQKKRFAEEMIEQQRRSERIDECIEAVCSLVEKLHERDFQAQKKPKKTTRSGEAVKKNGPSRLGNTSRRIVAQEGVKRPLKGRRKVAVIRGRIADKIAAVKLGGRVSNVMQDDEVCDVGSEQGAGKGESLSLAEGKNVQHTAAVSRRLLLGKRPLSNPDAVDNYRGATEKRICLQDPK